MRSCTALQDRVRLFSTRNLKPETRNPKPETRNQKPEARNPKPETQNPEPETRNPKPEIRNLKTETRDQKLGTWNLKVNLKPEGSLVQARAPGGGALRRICQQRTTLPPLV